MLMAEMSLVLVYICVLVIKSCDASSLAIARLADARDIGATVCSTFGFGESPEGVYLFFIFFGLGMVLLQICIGGARLYYTGNVPRVFLMATAFSMSPRAIFVKVGSRRCDWLHDVQTSNRISCDGLDVLCRTHTGRLLTSWQDPPCQKGSGSHARV